MTCEQAQELMIEALYGELDAASLHEFEQHVAGCAACARLYAEMRATGATMHDRTQPDPGAEYWNNYYTRLETRMQREATVVDGARIAARRRSYVSWGYRVAAAVAVLAAGVWIGQHARVNQPATQVARDARESGSNNSFTDTTRIASHPVQGDHTPHDAIEGPPTSGEYAGTGNVQLASADSRAKDYIERSQVLLLELINSSPDTTRASNNEYRTQQVRAKAMVREASVLRDDLPGSDNRRLRELVTELQLVLREIANLEAKNDYQAVEIIRNRVDREGVLLKIDVEQMRDSSGPKKPATTHGDAIDG
ncbi:MAG TPA: zf-HC2 domain-containing protein [Candidatus Krumholzibacteria bacterium]|nr:zf-HC2 domain-containing protein [Candidatus Krumholzibacteria bacterium]